MARLFGTDGIRGVANVEPMTAEMALAIGRATAHVCKRHRDRHRIVIGKDTRISGYMLETALTAGICSMGVDVLLVGPMPTPGIAFITHSMKADAGMVISASHNPYQDNGIKIFSRNGFKIPDEVEDEIESLVTTEAIKTIRPTAAEIGKAFRIDDALGRYIVFCKNTFPDNLTLSNLKIVLDCANGATYKLAPVIFWELGAEVITLNDHPNGMNINDRCGALDPSSLSRKVRECRANIGLAFDGDGDRLIAVDETGQDLTGDHLVAACARHMKDNGQLRNNLVVTTPMSNFGFLQAMKKLDIETAEADVGDRYVLKMMLDKGAVLGGETSGHIIFLQHHTTGDGIITALQLLAIMQTTGKPLSELAALIRLLPQTLINIEVAAKPALDAIPEIRRAMEAGQKDLGERGRLLVRYSGTQSICRVMVEAPEEPLMRRTADRVADAVRRAIGKPTA
ncbi:MAG: phosphoglucosamine mutase [Lentisphaerae bacterium]|nr:phosphoglucosamine mutase [Lentisphaerota bacterium]